MGDVIDFARFQKRAGKPKHKLTLVPTAQPAETQEQVTQFCVDEILAHWEKFAANNRLNEYFISCTPSWSSSTVNYLQNLEAISVIEQKIDLEPQITSPGFSGGEQYSGWGVQFKIAESIVSTPLMASECYARCFGILLFLKLKRELMGRWM